MDKGLEAGEDWLGGKVLDSMKDFFKELNESKDTGPVFH